MIKNENKPLTSEMQENHNKMLRIRAGWTKNGQMAVKYTHLENEE